SRRSPGGAFTSQVFLSGLAGASSAACAVLARMASRVPSNSREWGMIIPLLTKRGRLMSGPAARNRYGCRPVVCNMHPFDTSPPRPSSSLAVSTLGTPLSPSATRVMMLGSGELGKEVVIELQRFGCEVIAVDRYANAP